MRAELCENRTKHDLDQALRRVLEDKPLDQIRVRELTALCGIRRQSFYYHFPDVHALFSWSLQQEAAALAARWEGCCTWRQAVTDLLLHIGENRSYYRAILDCRGEQGLRALLREPLGALLAQTQDYYRRRCGGVGDRDAERAQLACGEALVFSLAESWIREPAGQPPETLLAPLEELLRQGALGRAWNNLAGSGQ